MSGVNNDLSSRSSNASEFSDARRILLAIRAIQLFGFSLIKHGLAKRLNERDLLLL